MESFTTLIDFAKQWFHKFAIVIFCLLFNESIAQIDGQYNYSQSGENNSGVYTPLSNATVVASVENGIGDTNEGVFNAMLPFDFNFGGSIYNHLKIYANGFVSFDNSDTSTSNPHDLQTAISPLGGNLIGLNIPNSNKYGTIAYKTEGNKFIVEWKNFTVYNPYISTNPQSNHTFDLSFQLILHQGGEIRFAYNIKKIGEPSNKYMYVIVKKGNSRLIRYTPSADTSFEATQAGSSQYIHRVTMTENNLPSEGFTMVFSPTLTPCITPEDNPIFGTIELLPATSYTSGTEGDRIKVTFVEPTPAPEDYLILRNETGQTTVPPTNGQIYSAGINNQLGGAYVYKRYPSETNSFTNARANTGIKGNTSYFYTLYAFNKNCSGGPKYQTNNPFVTDDVVTKPYRPEQVVVSAVTQTSFKIQWNKGNNGSALAMSSFLEVSKDETFSSSSLVAGFPYEAIASETVLEKTVLGLEANTKYFYRIRNISKKAGEVYGESLYVTGEVYTKCNATTSFTENFNSGNELPNCWSIITEKSDAEPTLPSITIDNANGHLNTNAVAIKGNADLSNAENKAVLVSPQISNIEDNGYLFSFKFKKLNANSNISLKILALKQYHSLQNSVIIHTINNDDITTEYNNISIAMPTTLANQGYQFIAIQRVDIDSSSAIDTVCIDDASWKKKPLCVDISHINITETGIHNAKINWNYTGSNAPNAGYEYLVSTSNQVPSATESNVTTTQNTFATIEQLTPNTQYYIYLRTVCSPTQKGDWFSVAFQTKYLQTLPWKEEFEGESSTLPKGWVTPTGNFTVGIRQGLTGTGITPANINAGLIGAGQSGANKKEFITPILGMIDNANYKFSFHFKQAETAPPYAPKTGWGKYTVEVSTDFGNTWTEIAVETDNNTTNYVKKEYNLGTQYLNKYVQFRIKVLGYGSTTNISYDSFELSSTQSVAVSEVSVKTQAGETSATITNANQQLQLVASILPANATNQSVVWTSSNPTVATVDNVGKITAVSNGESIITATSVADSSKKGIFPLVVNYTIPVQSIEVNASATDITTPSPIFLTAVVLPANASNKAVTWSSSNTNIATVTQNGTVYPLGNGTVTIKATSVENPNIWQSVTININIPVSITDIIIDTVEPNASTTLTQVGQTLALKATVLPSNAVQTVVWYSSNPLVATVESNTGVVTAVSNGQTVIKAATTLPNDGSYSTKVITVNIPIEVPVTSVEIQIETPNADTILNQAGETLKLKAVVTPNNATIKTVEWTSENPTVAKVDSTGKVTAISQGTTVIKAISASNPTIMAEITITVNINITVPIENISVQTEQAGASTTLYNFGDTLQLKAVISPANATIQDVIWSSSNQDIAQVDNTGLVMATGIGTAIIKATSVADNSKFATLGITVDSQASTQVPEQYSLVIYPNPSNGLFFIQTNAYLQKIEVFNTLGQTILSTQSNTVDITDHPSGTYLIKIHTANGVNVYKVVKK